MTNQLISLSFFQKSLAACVGCGLVTLFHPIAVTPYVATFKEIHRSCLKPHKPVKLGPSLEAKDSLGNQEIRPVLCNPTVHYRVMTSQPRGPTTNHVKFNPNHPIVSPYDPL